jgi:hypothetical protein
LPVVAVTVKREIVNRRLSIVIRTVKELASYPRPNVYVQTVDSHELGVFKTPFRAK